MERLSRSTMLWITGAFFVLTFALYGNSLSNSFVRWDDGMLIYDNPAIREITPSTLRTVFTSYDPELYIPLTFMSYQVDYALGGANPAVYHAQNLVWHTLNALLVAFFILLLSGRMRIALFCGLLFAVHPLHTEAVAWASARKDVLSTFFFLLSLIGYLSFRERGGTRRYIGSLAAFLLGLLAKVTVLTLPAVLILIDLYQGRKLGKQMVLEKLPYFGLTVLFAFIAFLGKTEVLGASTPTETLLISGKGIVFYVQKILVPSRLSVLYPFHGDVSFTNPSLLIPLLLTIALGIAAVAVWRTARTLFFTFAFFFITLSPSLLNFSKGDVLYFASDRYAYIPSIGMFFLLAVALSALRAHSRSGQYVSTAIIIVLLVSFPVLAVLQSQTWRNSETLFANALAYYPDSHVALNNIGNVHRSNKRPDLAADAYERALEAHASFARTPEGAAAQRSRSQILANFASAKRELNEIAAAEQLYRQAIDLHPENALAHMGLGIVYGKQQRYAEAEAAYKQAVVLYPLFATAYVNLGALYVGLDRLEEGIAQYDRAIEITPFYPQAHYNRGVALRKLQRNREAREAYEEAVRLAPDYLAARLNLSILYIEREWIDEALAQLDAVLRINSGNEYALALREQIQERMR